MIEPVLSASAAPDLRVDPKVRSKRPRAVPQVRKSPPTRKDPQPPARKPSRSERSSPWPSPKQPGTVARKNEHQDRMLSNLIRELEANDRDPEESDVETGESLDVLA